MDTSIYNKKLPIILIISISLVSVLDRNGNILVNGKQETRGNFAKTSPSNSKTSLGPSKFRKNIEFMKHKQQAQLSDPTSSGGDNRITRMENESSEHFLSENPIQLASLDGTLKQSHQQHHQVTREPETTSGAAGSFEKNQQSQPRYFQETNHLRTRVYGLVEGVAGADFPGLTSVPNTKFNCNKVPHEPGMYADESTGCQVYHLCFDGRRESFLCSIGTVFNQANLACDFWHQVDCTKSSNYYKSNLDFGIKSSAPQPRGQSTVARKVKRKLVLPSVSPAKLTNQSASIGLVGGNRQRQRKELALASPLPQTTVTASGSSSLPGPATQGGVIAVTSPNSQPGSSSPGGSHSKLMNRPNSKQPPSSQKMDSGGLNQVTGKDNSSAALVGGYSKTITTTLGPNSTNSTGTKRSKNDRNLIKKRAKSQGGSKGRGRGKSKARIKAKDKDNDAWRRPHFRGKSRTSGPDTTPNTNGPPMSTPSSAISIENTNIKPSADTQLDLGKDTSSSSLSPLAAPELATSRLSSMQSSLAEDSEVTAQPGPEFSASGTAASQLEFGLGFAEKEAISQSTLQASDSSSTVDQQLGAGGSTALEASEREEPEEPKPTARASSSSVEYERQM